MIVARFLSNKVKGRLQDVEAVTLLGARQVGKSTLARQFVAKDREHLYLDLESPRDLEKLSDPYSFLSQYKSILVVIDEIQRKPELFPILRVLIDESREHKRKSRYLILGSSSTKLIQQSSESLAGRISYIKMNPFNVLEIDPLVQETLKLWMRGGFPKSYLAEQEQQGQQWREDFITTYLRHDIPNLAFPIAEETLRRLLTMLAHCQGQQLQCSQLARSIGIDGKTVKRYIDLLIDLFILVKLPPFHANIKKRLVKSPRLYLADTGLLHSLLQIHSYEALISHPIVGASWEGFVVNNILSVLPESITPCFYRTAAGAEIDLVLKIGGEIWAMEIKKSAENLNLSRGYHQACQDIEADRKFVVYGGEERFPYKQETTVMGVLEMIREIQKHL